MSSSSFLEIVYSYFPRSLRILSGRPTLFISSLTLPPLPLSLRHWPPVFSRSPTPSSSHDLHTVQYLFILLVRSVFGSGTDLISLFILLLLFFFSFFLLGRPLQKSLRLRRFKSDRDELFGRIVLQVNTHRLTESDFRLTSHVQDGCRGVISRKKVLPPG